MIMTKDKKNILAEKAVLVRFTTKHWSGIKSDKQLRNKLSVDTNASTDLLNVQKHLIDNDHAKYFRRIINKVRNDFYYPMTLPWDDNSTDVDDKVVSGWRLCPNTQLDKLSEAMDTAKRDFFKEVRAFVETYDQKVEDAEALLGSAYDISDYPDVSEVEAKFKFDFEVNLISSFGNNDLRLNVSEKMRQKIENDVENRIKNNVASQTKVIVEALVEQVSHLADKLKSYDPKDVKKGGFFKDSSVDKLRQAIQVLPSFNNDVFGSDADIAKAHSNLVSVMSKIDSVDSLRDQSPSGQSKRDQISNDLQKAIDPLKDDFLSKLGGKNG
tara:strand:- start:71 stop:1048 length:978 start_codon:yes stop_codon:yes gene_type:complete